MEEAIEGVPPGTVLDGKFRVERMLGIGGMMPMPGRELIRADAVDSVDRRLFVIRFRSAITTDHIVLIKGQFFEIESLVEVEGKRGFLELIIKNSERDYVLV